MDCEYGGGGEDAMDVEQPGHAPELARGSSWIRRATSVGHRTETRLEALQRAHRAAIEALMHKHGDLILRIFHTYDFSFRAPFNWQGLLHHIREVCALRQEQAQGAGQGAGAAGAETADDMVRAVNDMAADFTAALQQIEHEIGQELGADPGAQAA
eukprot:CAMPEP_0119122974 /NCGR_PEP_ID=MMETSP1310-20130426/3065_1 /TAXON_ID=464262 /ORGANISM="Genus nov. species nov., Strain RCC2339" /LENGTH=155 /DNA_ID=CAMNT_0007112709 /DNA_START=20 /DNA_END=487 /DNA_ORIENTATION=+